MNWSALEHFRVQDIPVILTRLTRQVSRLVLIFIVAWLVYSGIRYFLSAGNPAAYSDTKKNFYWSLAGILVVFGVYTIIVSIATFIGYSGLPLVPLQCT